MEDLFQVVKDTRLTQSYALRVSLHQSIYHCSSCGKYPQKAATHRCNSPEITHLKNIWLADLFAPKGSSASMKLRINMSTLLHSHSSPQSPPIAPPQTAPAHSSNPVMTRLAVQYLCTTHPAGAGLLAGIRAVKSRSRWSPTPGNVHGLLVDALQEYGEQAQKRLDVEDPSLRLLVAGRSLSQERSTWTTTSIK